MPNKCCVYNCKSNYDSQKGIRNHVKVFSFPIDLEQQDKWVKCLPNSQFQITKSKRICELHWPPNYKKKVVKGGYKVPCEPPSVFLDIPKSCIPVPLPKPRQTFASNSRRNMFPDELEHFLEQDKLTISKIKDIVSKMTNLFLCENAVDHQVCIYSRDRIGPVHKFSVFINQQDNNVEYNVECFSGIKKVLIPFVTSHKLKSLSQFENMLHYLQNLENEQDKKIKFISHQIELLNNPIGKPYSLDDLTSAMNIASRSRSAYLELRNYIVLPSIRQLQKVTSKVDKVTDAHFLRSMFANSNAMQKQCIIVLDEVYIKPGFQYSGGPIFDEAVNIEKRNIKTTTILAIMVQGCCGGPKFIYKLYPVCKLNSEYQCFIIRNVLISLHAVGLTPLCIILDNN